jgi:mRNA-degrading endonuclease RelE of RelBE toxin-antitoxin system
MTQIFFKFSSKAEIDLLNLPVLLQKRIIKKLDFFEKCQNPLSYAKKLIGSDNKYRFRVGDYRVIISKISEDKFIILFILKIAHRSQVYE